MFQGLLNIGQLTDVNPNRNDKALDTTFSAKFKRFIIGKQTPLERMLLLKETCNI